MDSCGRQCQRSPHEDWGPVDVVEEDRLFNQAILNQS